MNDAMNQLGQHCWEQLQAYTDRVAIFPLPGATLLPRASLPLHIFEPRYRAMVEYALSHGRFVGRFSPSPTRSKQTGAQSSTMSAASEDLHLSANSRTADFSSSSTDFAAFDQSAS